MKKMTSRPSALARVFATEYGEPAGSKIELPAFRVVVADPPWAFGDALPGPGRGAGKNYELLSTDAIAERRFVGGDALDLVADDAYLFLWRVSAGSDIGKPTLVEDAYRVARAWGFAPKTELVWRKQTKNGKRHFGMGRHLRMEHETCIVAVRGKVAPLVRDVRSVFDAPAPSGANGRTLHSAKPDAFFDLVARMRGGPYLELFARRQRSGWTCVGDAVSP